MAFFLKTKQQQKTQGKEQRAQKYHLPGNLEILAELPVVWHWVLLGDEESRKKLKIPQIDIRDHREKSG